MADLAFSAKVHFFLKFLSKNISGALKTSHFNFGTSDFWEIPCCNLTTVGNLTGKSMKFPMSQNEDGDSGTILKGGSVNV